METNQIAPSHGHFQEEQPHDTGLRALVEGEEEHHEKKPVLKKVKEKVKKIKDNISKKTHGHGEDHGHSAEVSEDDEGYEEDDEQREMDPEVRGADHHVFVVNESPVGGNWKLATGKDEKINQGAAERVSVGELVGSGKEDPSAPNSSTARSDEVRDSPITDSLKSMSISDQSQSQKDRLQTPPTGSHDQFSPEEKPKEPEQPASYTDKISSAAAAAKDTAMSAAIGSTEYGKKIASTVYGKVAETGTAVMGKVQQKSETIPGDQQSVNDDKGVSVKEYLVGKLRPGDEDRALAEVISEAVHGKKEGQAEVISEADHGKKEGLQVEEAEGIKGSERAGGGKGMVEKIKGAVTSLVGSRSSPAADTQMKGNGTAEGSEVYQREQNIK